MQALSKIFGLLIDMKKIAFFCYNIDESGGLERVLSLIANALANQSEIKVTIISIFKNDNKFFNLDEKIKICYISNNKSYYSIIRQTRKILKNEKIDKLIVVDTLMSFISLPASIGLNIKSFAWEHYSFYSTIVNRKRKISRLIVKIFFEKVVLLTERDKDNWAKRSITKNKFLVIENPSPFSLQIDDNKSNCKVALAIGRLRKEKGFDLLIEAWALAKSKLPEEATLLIIGEGEEKGNLKKIIAQLNMKNSITITGFTRDVSKYYRNARIYCLSSRTEALPMVLIESLSFSVPLLAFDCYTGPREIIKNGYNGFIIEENNIQSYADKIIELFSLESDDFSSLSYNAYISSSRYSIDIIIRKWLDILR